MYHEFEPYSGDRHCKDFTNIDFPSYDCRIEYFDKKIVQRSDQFDVKKMFISYQNDSLLFFILIVEFGNNS